MKGTKEEKTTRIVRNGRNTVESARDKASEESTEAFKTLKPVFEKASDPDAIRRIGYVMVSLKQINRYMEAIGAKTDAISEKI
jgi:hypothetical protein